MATTDQQLIALQRKLDAAIASFSAQAEPGWRYLTHGTHCLFGCKITEGLSAADFTLALDGAAAGDAGHTNPDRNANPTRIEEYSNTAVIYGDGFAMNDVNTSALVAVDPSLIIDAAPSDSGTGRYDIVYLYVTSQGAGIGVLGGTPSTGAFANFASSGIKQGAYGDTFDPLGLPHGAMPVARVYVQTGDTGIPNARIVDLRRFSDRMREGWNTVNVVAGSNIVIDWDRSEHYVITTTANCVITLPAPKAYRSGTIDIINGGGHSVTFAGGGTLRWPGNVAPTLTTTAGRRDKLRFDSTGTTNTHGSVIGLNYFA